MIVVLTMILEANEETRKGGDVVGLLSLSEAIKSGDAKVVTAVASNINGKTKNVTESILKELEERA